MRANAGTPVAGKRLIAAKHISSLLLSLEF
jgi:hypothetical protein